MSGRVEIRKSRVHLTVGCGHDGLDGGVARVAHDVDVALVADGLPFQRVHMLPLHQNTKSAPSERQAHGGVCRTWYIRGTTVRKVDGGTSADSHGVVWKRGKVFRGGWRVYDEEGSSPQWRGSAAAARR